MRNDNFNAVRDNSFFKVVDERRKMTYPRSSCGLRGENGTVKMRDCNGRQKKAKIMVMHC